LADLRMRPALALAKEERNTKREGRRGIERKGEEVRKKRPDVKKMEKRRKGVYSSPKDENRKSLRRGRKSCEGGKEADASEKRKKNSRREEKYHSRRVHKGL